jgi:short chain dehydrogenase
MTSTPQRRTSRGADRLPAPHGPQPWTPAPAPGTRERGTAKDPAALQGRTARPQRTRLRDGWLSLEDIDALPHATAFLGHSGLNPADRVLDEPGVRRRVQVKVAGLLPLPFVVAGTGLVAIVPERLARRVASMAGVFVVEPPFGQVDLIEAAWWHPARSADPALCWLRGVLKDTAAALAPVLSFPLMGNAADTSRRVAVVTGGSGGLGGAITARLRADGLRVAVADLDPGPAHQAGDPGLLAVPVDVTDAGSAAAMRDQVLAHWAASTCSSTTRAFAGPTSPVAD